MGEKWELALKRVDYQSDVVYDGSESELKRFDNPRSKRSLLTASRSARIKALTLLPKLLDQIKAGAEKMLDGIETAQKVAEKL